MNMSMWLCTIAAPACRHASASAAISAGSTGTFGLRFLFVTPLIAASMITGSAMAATVASRPMRIDLTPEQRALQREVREYFASLMTPERQADLRDVDAGGTEI